MHFVLWAIGYQVIWHFAFQFIFHYQDVIKHARNIIFAKLLGEVLLYAIFSLRFAFLGKETDKWLKLLLFFLAFSLWLLTLYALIKIIYPQTT